MSNIDINMDTDKHFLIGDVQGQHELLKRLLHQEGLLDDEGKRLQPQVEVIQLGDLGHFARYNMGSQPISEEDDWECFKLLQDGVIDFMLWGNHDRPLMGHLGSYTFGGFTWPNELQFVLAVRKFRDEGKIRLAASAGDFLLTHAGLHAAWGWDENEDVDIETDPQKIADKFNAFDDKLFDPDSKDKNRNTLLTPFVDTIGRVRGGMNRFGGILWRDDNDEELWDGVRQVYGHTARPTIASQPSKVGDSYCIDVSKADRIGAIWLPSERVVTIGKDDLPNE